MNELEEKLKSVPAKDFAMATGVSLSQAYRTLDGERIKAIAPIFKAIHSITGDTPNDLLGYE